MSVTHGDFWAVSAALDGSLSNGGAGATPIPQQNYVRWPAVALGLFTGSSSLAGVPILQELLGSVSVATTAFAAAGAARVTLGRGSLPPPLSIGPLYLLLFFLFVPIAWAAGSPYGQQKSFGVLIGLTVSMVATVVILRSRPALWSWIWTVIAVNGVAVALTLPSALASQGLRIGVAGQTNPIVAGRAAGLFICLLLGAVVLRSRRTSYVAAGGAVGLAMPVLLASGSQGPVVATVIGLGGLTLLSKPVATSRPTREARRAMVVVGLFSGAGSALYSAARRLSAHQLHSLLEPLSGQETRAGYFAAAFEGGFTRPWGHGWGKFGRMVDGYDSAVYPHNLLLELWVEAGWVPTFLMTALLLVVAVRLTTIRQPEAVIVAVLLIFAVVNAMVSGDVLGNRLVFIGLALAWSRSWTRESTPGRLVTRP